MFEPSPSAAPSDVDQEHGDGAHLGANPGGNATRSATTWDMSTVAILVIRTIAVVTALVALYNVQRIFLASNAAGPVVVTLLMLVAAGALWWFAEPLVAHMMKLHADSGAPENQPGESIVDAATRTGVVEWHAMFLSLLGVFLLVQFTQDFLMMLFRGFAHTSGATVFVTLLMLGISVMFVLLPKKLLQVLPMYKSVQRQPVPAESSQPLQDESRDENSSSEQVGPTA